MTLLELKERIDAQLELNPGQRTENLKVVIQVQGSSFGPTPNVEINGAAAGFDWNSGLYLLRASEAIRRNDK